MTESTEAELGSIVRVIVGRSLRARSGLSALDTAIRSTVKDVETRYQQSQSVTPETAAGIAVARIVGRLMTPRSSAA